MAKLIDGTAIGEQIRGEIGAETAAFRERTGLAPGLATVLVGTDPASQAYVRMKGRAADRLGFLSRQITLPATITHDALIDVVDSLNQDPEIHGILVQLPLPPQIQEREVIERIDPAKDVDGFHPINVGRLATGDPDVLAPCTPAGIVELLMRSGHPPRGRRVVIVGRSNIVGRPLALLLLRRGEAGDATVTVAHSRTRELADVTREAEILVAAVGRPGLITGDMVRSGVVVIDVGSNRIDDASAAKGYRFVGDVAFDEVEPVAAAITPVPGGVGPMTITMLMSNTLHAARRQAAGIGREAP
jgi:methylenetetrahydrofolate dehydrogenase (NADP+) / methenyltetrahydrofolate cyclohydrolase